MLVDHGSTLNHFLEVIKDRKIEKTVSGRINGNDVSAGFEKGWVEMVDLNLQVAAPGTQEAMDSAIDKLKHQNGLPLHSCHPRISSCV